MKKSLFLLPLAGSFLLAGCSFEIIGKKIEFKLPWEKEETAQQEDQSGKGTGNGSGSGQQNGNQNGGNQQGGGQAGTGLATVTMTALQDAVDKEATPLVFANGGCTVTVSQGSNTGNTVAQAAQNTGTYEFRVYKGFDVKFAADTEFSKLEIAYSTHTSGSSTYYFDFDVEGATNEFDNEQGKALLTLDQSAKEFTVANFAHQTRIASVTFLA